MATITVAKARQIFDSRGNPTVEVCFFSLNSRGSVCWMYTHQMVSRSLLLFEWSLTLAVGNVNNIIGPALIGKDPTQQIAIDNFMVHELDGTQNEWGWCKQKV
ncbi:hypothetical protein YC2023_047263 [Brassica napus]